jgi:hypothetical protein
MKVHIPSHLNDDELVAEVQSLVRSERHATARLVAHLAELDRRRLYLGAGFSSLFAYCTGVLRLSENEAYNRIEAARAARRFPVILDKLLDGSLSITTVRLLAPYLADESREALLAAASGKSKREVEELIARYSPRPDVASSVRRLPARASTTPVDPMSVPTASTPLAPVTAPVLAALPAPAPNRRPLVSPLSPDRYEIRFTASAEMREKLRLAQDLLRHAVPNGDPAEIFDRALTALLEELARKKWAATERPRSSRGTAPGSRDIPAKVRRAVWLRDHGRCAFRSRGGRRCNERAFVEFHHLDPHGVGGHASIGNIELRCRAHNLYEAELFYGRRGPAEPVTRSGKSNPPRLAVATSRNVTTGQPRMIPAVPP